MLLLCRRFLPFGIAVHTHCEDAELECMFVLSLVECGRGCMKERIDVA